MNTEVPNPWFAELARKIAAANAMMPAFAVVARNVATMNVCLPKFADLAAFMAKYGSLTPTASPSHHPKPLGVVGPS